MQLMPTEIIPSAAKATKSSLLLVDDDSVTLEMLSMHLESPRFKIYTAGNISSALKIAKDENISLVVTDLGLPDGSGIDLVKHLKNLNVGKVIAVTGYCRDEAIQNAGFYAFFTKPIDIDSLLATIETAVN